jgi:DNA-binding NtrC family response regulator
LRCDVTVRVLVVDDDGHERRSLSLGLRVSGFTVTEAQDANHALALVEAQPFDVVITDLVMPGQSGIQLASQLQSRFPELPVVLTSGYELGRRQLERAGVKLLAFVHKPYDLGELVGFLRGKVATRLAG